MLTQALITAYTAYQLQVNNCQCHKTRNDNISITEEITYWSLVNGVKPKTALRIAWCESRNDPLAKNKNSSASGIYQFTKGTWKALCTGDVFNKTDNIKCFTENYNKYSYYWECK